MVDHQVDTCFILPLAHSNGVSAASSGQYPLYQQRMTHVSQPVTINQAAIPVAVAAHSVFPGQQPSPGQKSADSRPASSAEQPAIKLKLRVSLPSYSQLMSRSI